MSHFKTDSINTLSETEDLHIHLKISQGGENQKETATSSMSLPPKTTPAPHPVFMPGMSHRTQDPAATPSPIPVRPKSNDTTKQQKGDENQGLSINLPRLRLHIQDINHGGSNIFLSSINAATVLRSSIETIHKHLYTPSSPSSSAPTPPTLPLNPPPTRSVTLILRPMDGVAYTTGSDLDSDHKEIHFSLSYISSIPSSRQTHEISGVIVHELVHCYQWNGQGRAPGGLIEGMADWVRLQAGLAPPHWDRKQVPSKWDAGYQHTAYFLEYLENRFGEGSVRQVNAKLRTEKYDGKTFWLELFGVKVDELFDAYKKTKGKA
ncbi:BSP-domain-containing protein [Hypoxylon trugodes]|uniref:BSP-domain-containing protein n=1 Tax=Hypoxylon trugodes TaxID=326681 RepID=UPI002190C081|nr:BSP-domain-containing protein [Hypoxylon trugodes]KAI1383146.1 BSP-domain-containing protein [Hypoxylon trugodes]